MIRRHVAVELDRQNQLKMVAAAQNDCAYCKVGDHLLNIGCAIATPAFLPQPPMKNHS